MPKNRKTVNVKSVNIQQAAEEFYLSNQPKVSPKQRVKFIRST